MLKGFYSNKLTSIYAMVLFACLKSGYMYSRGR
jgi:hypothetical protein